MFSASSPSPILTNEFCVDAMTRECDEHTVSLSKSGDSFSLYQNLRATMTGDLSVEDSGLTAGRRHQPF
jgi:hypothetical protein